MKSFLTAAAALVLGLTVQTAVLAGDGHGQSGNHVGQTSNGGRQGQVKSTDMKPQHGQIQQTQGNHKDKKGPGKYDYCKNFKDYKGPCYHGKNHKFWSRCYWDRSYGCNLYWCQNESCWFYWCQPYGCYLPVEYCPCGTYVFAEQ